MNTCSEFDPQGRNPALSSALISDMFPAGVRAAELRGHGDVSQLLSGETEFLPHAVPKRIQEFVDGRLCARRALMDLGIEDFPLKIGDDRRPLWPRSIVGRSTALGALVYERPRRYRCGRHHMEEVGTRGNSSAKRLK